MASLWSWADKKHRVRLAGGKWHRLVFIDDKTGKRNVGGSVHGFTPDVTAQGQLYTGTQRGTDYISSRFGRVFHDGRPTDYTGFQDHKAPTGKRTFNFSPTWIGDLNNDYDLVLEVRCPKDFVMGNRIYKGIP